MTSYVEDRLPITKRGFDALEEELKKLQEERPAIIQAISDARDLGDLSENAEYTSAKERQSIVEGKIADLETKKSKAEIIDVSCLSGDTVKFGATVTLIPMDDGKSGNPVVYQIVGVYEADVSKNMLSIQSPLAKCLIGKKEGEEIDIQTPSGEDRSYKIMKVEFK